jgi:hypothetical protein
MSDSVSILHYRDLFVSKNTELMNKMRKKLKKTILNNYFNTLCVYLSLFCVYLSVFEYICKEWRDGPIYLPKVPPSVAVAIPEVFKRAKFVALWSPNKTIRTMGPQLICCLNVHSKQGLQEKFYKADKTALGPRGQAETSLKIEDLRSN